LQTLALPLGYAAIHLNLANLRARHDGTTGVRLLISAASRPLLGSRLHLARASRVRSLNAFCLSPNVRIREPSMRVNGVLMRAVNREITWIQASEILGCTTRSLRRWKLRYQ